MKHLLATLAALLLSACSSAPYFRKAATPAEDGYSVRDSERKEIFDVSVRLPAGTNQADRLDYLTRAAGEECLSRGFLFFDVGSLTPASARGFCYPQPKRPSLGVEFDLNAYHAKDSVIRIDGTELNFPTSLRPRDVVKKVAGKEAESIGALKQEIHEAGAAGRKSVTVAVERSGIALNLEAPIAEHKRNLLTPDSLEALRKKLP